MIVEIATIALPLALVFALGLGIGGWRLFRRFTALERRLGLADERFDALATTLGEELGALRRAREGEVEEIRRLAREVERLAADVVQRELYRGAGPRHAGAIDAVRGGGQDAQTLAREHGLSLDEAELLVSLHGGGAGAAAAAIAKGR